MTLEERRIMQGHSEIGERILANVDDYGGIADIVRHHHERVDGYGYPDGLGDEEIPNSLPDYRRCGCIQRDDVGSPLPRSDAEPGREDAPRSGGRFAVRYDGRGSFRSNLATADDAYRLGKTPDFDFFSQDVKERLTWCS